MLFVKNTNKRIKTKFPFSTNLAIVLKSKNVSQVQAARICGVSKSVVSGWLSSHGTPSDLIAVKKLCIELKVSFEWLLTGESEELNQTTNKIDLNQLFEAENSEFFSGYFEIKARRIHVKN